MQESQSITPRTLASRSSARRDQSVAIRSRCFAVHAHQPYPSLGAWIRTFTRLSQRCCSSYRSILNFMSFSRRTPTSSMTSYPPQIQKTIATSLILSTSKNKVFIYACVLKHATLMVASQNDMCCVFLGGVIAVFIAACCMICFACIFCHYGS